jgi:hypothetical protein
MTEDKLDLHSYVMRVDSDRQIGRIIAFDGDKAIILWGVQDGKVYTEGVAINELRHATGQKGLDGKPRPTRKNIFDQ